MNSPISRRHMLQATAATCLAGSTAEAGPGCVLHRPSPPGWVTGRMTGAEAAVEALIQEGVECVYGIPGAQMNELWDTMKEKHLPYLLVTNELSAAVMADGYARVKGRPGVLCIVPGPGVTNSLTGLGEALLDSVPVVAVVGDIANGDHYRPFQVHSLNNAALLQPVTKHVIAVQNAAQICHAVRQAFALAVAGEPGPVAVVIPYNLLIEVHDYHCGPAAPPPLPWDEPAFRRAVGVLSDCRHKVGIYAGLGCMDHAEKLVRLAEVLQAPVATSISGKGSFPENHPLSVGWGYGPQGRYAAEKTFRHVDVVLAMGVKFGEVSTGYYSLPPSRHLIHVDADRRNLGRVMRTEVCVHADAGLFMDRLLGRADCVRRRPSDWLVRCIDHKKGIEERNYSRVYARCGTDPVLFLRALRRCTCPDALLFVDVTVSQYWATEVFQAVQPRTFFNPTNNQSMGWSVAAAIGAQKVSPGRQVLTVTGDGCFLMTAMEVSTAARECLPVKFFVLDDQAYHYMQLLQEPAYRRTTATELARLDYAALARGWGVAYQEICGNGDIEARIRGALLHPGPVLVRVVTDYDGRPIRWIDAARARYTQELSAQQKVRFLARIAARSCDRCPDSD